MTAKSFVDSNVVLYTIGKDVRKANIARNLMAEQPAVSDQVISECVSVCLRKLSFTREQGQSRRAPCNWLSRRGAGSPPGSPSPGFTD